MAEAMIRHFIRTHPIEEAHACEDCALSFDPEIIRARVEGEARAREESYGRDHSKGDAWAC